MPAVYRPTNVVYNNSPSFGLNGSRLNQVNTSNVVFANRNVTAVQDNIQRTNVVVPNPPPVLISNQNVNFRPSLQIASKVVPPVSEVRTVRPHQFNIQTPVYVRP